MAEKDVPKKKTVKKATKKVASKKVATKKVVRKAPVVSRARKAPTAVAERNASAKKYKTILLTGIGIFVVVVGASVTIGFSGSGEINIDGVIAETKSNATPEEKKIIESIPVQNNKAKVRDGGLVAAGAPPPKTKPKPEPVATSTEASASSTDPTATSTDPLIEDIPPEEGIAEEELENTTATEATSSEETILP